MAAMCIGERGPPGVLGGIDIQPLAIPVASNAYDLTLQICEVNGVVSLKPGGAQR